MNTKSPGGVLTPYRGFVCLRCRLGNGIINLGRPRRYQQTNAQSAVSDAVNNLPFEKSGDSHDPLKSNSERPAEGRQPTSILGSPNAPTKPQYTTRQEPIADMSISKPVQSESESQARLQQKYLELRRNLAAKHVHFSLLKEHQNHKAVRSAKVNVPGGLKFTKTKQEQSPPTNESKTSKKRRSVNDTKKSKQAEQRGRNEALTAGEERDSVLDATESKRAARKVFSTTFKADEKSGSVRDATESKRAARKVLSTTFKADEKSGSVKDATPSKRAARKVFSTTFKADEKSGSVKDATESKRAARKVLSTTFKADEKSGSVKDATPSKRTARMARKRLSRTSKAGDRSGSVKDATESKRAVREHLSRTFKTGEKSGSVKDATKSKRAAKIGSPKTVKVGEGSNIIKYIMDHNGETKGGSNKAAKIIKTMAGVISKPAVKRRLDKAGKAVDEVGEGSNIIKYIMEHKEKTKGGSNKTAKIIKSKTGVKSKPTVIRRLATAGKADEVAEVKAVKITKTNYNPKAEVKSVKIRITNNKSVRANAESEEILKPPGTFSMPGGPEIHHLNAKELKISVIATEELSVPSLSYGLERVLFNPGVFHLQDPRSRVFNFDPYLQTIMPIEEFNFNALRKFTTSSQDENLKRLAEVHGKRYRGSSSSMTGVLSQFHYLLSQWRAIDSSMLSRNFTDVERQRSFTSINKIPSAIFLRWRDGTYAIDKDKEFDRDNVLCSLGISMEKLLTSDAKDFERYRKSNSDQISPEDANSAKDYHYSTMGDILMRSQLDAYDSRLPGTGMFDLKTRSVLSIRMDVTNYKLGIGYQIKSPQGQWESYEREYFDMIRSAFLKYSLQVRMGRMDGIFVAYHNIERIFGFQYIPLPEMDKTIHGTFNTMIGNQEFKMSLNLLNRILDKATKKYPRRSLRLHFETREMKPTFMYVFAEPVTETRVQEIQSKNAAKEEEFERSILGLEGGAPSKEHEQEKEVKWADIEASVQEAVAKDELSLLDGNMDQESSLEEASDEEIEVDDDEDEMGRNNKEKGELSEIHRGGKNGVLSSMVGLDGAGRQTVALDEEPLPDDGSSSSSREVSDLGDQEVSAEADGAWDGPLDVPGEVLAMTLTVRNKVNGEYVLRPTELGPRDDWTIEYSLAEEQDGGRAWSLYMACKKRRKGESVWSGHRQVFIRSLRKMSREGTIWRKEMDKKDEARPRVVLGRD